jgi:hypothetical protein
MSRKKNNILWYHAVLVWNSSTPERKGLIYFRQHVEKIGKIGGRPKEKGGRFIFAKKSEDYLSTKSSFSDG